MNPQLTQKERVLNKLRNENGGWISARVFIQEMLISQAHARIWELQREGHQIEASVKVDEFGFKFYRLTKENIGGVLYSRVLPERKDAQPTML